jgi:arylsulfatase A-like enzyme
MMSLGFSTVARRYGEPLRDLRAFALVQFGWTAFSVLFAKAAALFYTYQGDSLGANASRLPSAAAHDALLLGVAGVVVLAAGRLRGPSNAPARLAALVAIYLGFALWTLLSFVSIAFFMTLGSALNYDLLTLAPDLVGHFVHSVTPTTAGVMVAAGAFVLCPLLLAAYLCPPAATRSASRVAMWMSLVLLSVGVGFSYRTPTSSRDKTLRNMTPAFMLMPPSFQLRLDTPPPSAGERAVVAQLAGRPRAEDERALAPLRRGGPRNVVLVIWESAGERYLRAHHPLGEVDTPHLTALAARGSVRFTHTYAECPLSVQSMWSIVTGLSPPAKPQIFLAEGKMPAHGPTLPQVLRSSGFRTAMLIGSYTRCWRADRIMALGGFDVAEDISSLANRDRFPRQNWSIDGRALNDRLWEWLRESPSDRPFFAVVWSVESHFPYQWPTMTDAERSARAATRYLRSIGHLDDVLGDLYGGLEARGLADDTLVIVLGDHGEGTGRPPHPDLLIHGMKVNEDCIQVPLVFLNASLGGETRVDTPATLTDIFPTLVDLLGIDTKLRVDGQSLARPAPARPLFARSIQWWPIAMRVGAYKLILDDPEESGELYDIEHDPGETVDLSSAEPAIAGALRAHTLYYTAQRRRFDPSMDMDRIGLFPEVPSAMVPTKRDLK